MTPVAAAQRLGVHETAVRTVEDRENDCVVTLRDESRWLISETVARPYVADIDDEESVAESDRVDRGTLLRNLPYSVSAPAEAVEEPEDAAELDEPAKSKAPVKRTAGKAKG